MILNNINEDSHPFQHWEVTDCLNNEALDEISFSQIPHGERAYDGTRAADHSGEGIDGKLRLFITKQNNKFFPELTKVINFLQKKDTVEKIASKLKKNLSEAYVRLEIIGDKKGFWLKPHKDIKEKLMTMMIWANPYNESKNLGTDLYDDNFNLIKLIYNAIYAKFKYIKNTYHK